MLLIVSFTENGVPKTGLSPTIDVWNADGSQVVTAQAMSEIGGGFYKYDFSTYDEDEDYCIRADGTSTLSNSERYAFATNESAGVGNILKIEKNKLEIASNTLTIYDDDGVTALYQWDLQDGDGNPTQRNILKRIPQ